MNPVCDPLGTENILGIAAGYLTGTGAYIASGSLVFGAVMGSKKLKAVAVKGDVPIQIADPEGMRALRKQHLPTFKEEFGSDLSEFGTPMFYEEALNSGDAPWKNWSSSVEEMKDFKTTAEKVKEYQLKRYACSGCPVGCGGRVEVKQGPFKTDGPVHKVEYETMSLFGYAILSYKTLPEYLKAADGTEWTMEELAAVGRRLTLARYLS